MYSFNYRWPKIVQGYSTHYLAIPTCNKMETRQYRWYIACQKCVVALCVVSFFEYFMTTTGACSAKVHKVTELMMMARRAMSKLNFPRFVSLYPKRILVWGSVSLRVASDKAREIQFGHSPSCHHHQFCHFMNFRC